MAHQKLLAADITKVKFTMNKPVYSNVSILELSKIEMHEF